MVAALLLLALGISAALAVVNALRPPHAWWILIVSWLWAWITTELALHLMLFGLLAGAGLVLLGALDHTVGWVGLGLLAVAQLSAIPLLWRAHRTTVDMGSAIDELELEDDAPRYPRSHILFPFLMLRRRGVKYRRGVTFWEEDGERLKMDVYLPENPPAGKRPAIVQVHGGAWVLGSRREQGIPLLTHLAANGWVGFNIDYRLSPFATWPDHIVDVKRAIAHVRENAEQYGIDPDFIAVTGGSAGGHLSALAGLTSDDRSLQPGFEDSDTSVAAAVPFYGVYDFVDDDRWTNPVMHWLVLEPLVFKTKLRKDREAFRAASPRFRVHENAPPYLVIHGEWDSLITARQARRFADELREVSRNPVFYGEMRGGQHAFDFFPSWRTIPVVEGIERFLSTLHERYLAGDEQTAYDLEEALTE